MQKIYFTVGPSQVYPTVYKHLDRAMKKDIPSISHRGTQFKEIFAGTTEDLKKLMNIPADFQIFFVSSALECMERTMQSCCQNTSFHIVAGSFGKAWANIATQLGKNAQSFVIQNNGEDELNGLKVPEKTEIICITQNETSTGLCIPMDKIIDLKKRNDNKLMAIDIVSSVPYVSIDFKYIDIAFFSVQKGFGLPAGLAVLIIGPKALEKTEKLIKKNVQIGSYHSFKNLFEKAKDYQTPETPNVLNIYLLNSVIKDMQKIGINKIRKDTDKKSKIIYDFFKKNTKYSPFIKNPIYRSKTTLVIDVLGKSGELRKKLAKSGFIIGAGYGANKENHIRIANFPAHSLKDIHAMLKHI